MKNGFRFALIVFAIFAVAITSVIAKNSNDNGDGSAGGGGAGSIFGGRIGKEKIHFDKKIKMSDRKFEMLHQKVMNALISEAAKKYNISAEPEFSEKWKQSLEIFKAYMHKDFNEAPPAVQNALEKKKIELHSAVLKMKVDEFIFEDLKKNDPEFSIYFSEDPNVIAANLELISKINSTENALTYESKKRNKWWIQFIANETAEFFDEDCKKTFEKIKREGPSNI
jgi:hypothetical protein